MFEYKCLNVSVHYCHGYSKFIRSTCIFFLISVFSPSQKPAEKQRSCSYILGASRDLNLGAQYFTKIHCIWYQIVTDDETSP